MQTRNHQQLAIQLVSDIESFSGKTVILVSGGSQIEKLAEVFREFIKEQIDFGRLTIGLVDERYDRDPNHQGSNFAKLMQLTEAQELERRGVEFKPVLDTNPDLIDSGESYAAWVDDISSDDSYQLVGIFGIGNDFHTAGIFPHTSACAAMFYGASYVGYEPCGEFSGNTEYPRRVTLTFDGIKLLDKCYIYCVGEEKKEVLSELKATDRLVSIEEISQKPCLFFASLNEATLFTD